MKLKKRETQEEEVKKMLRLVIKRGEEGRKKKK